MGQQLYPGKVALFGSGETAASGRAIHDRLLSELSPPVPVAILETPAGFQPNSAAVAGEVKDYMEAHLQNHRPRISIIPARKKGSDFSPDDPAILEPLREAAYIFMGPGSPTYAVRNLQDTLAWRYLRERHRAGAYLSFASAATLAVGAKVLPVYEVFKAGAEPHWVDGLDLFGSYGLELALVPHWNNAEGGAKLDTSRCFMGAARMEHLRRLLPETTLVLGIDEHTALLFDLRQGLCSVHGKGGLTLWWADRQRHLAAGEECPLGELGPYVPPEPALIPTPAASSTLAERSEQPGPLPPRIARLVARREAARGRRDWAQADALRAQVAQLGFELIDTNQGVRWRRLG